jgi:ubiquinone/menaquinone biosynthesis C-methylase UbiE
VSHVIRYDEGPARRIQRLSETPEMRAQRRRVIELLAPRRGERILDVGCGPGHLISEIADRVGPEGRACGVDVSEQMLALAGRSNVELAHVNDTRLPFEDASFDAAVATQAYEFVEELSAALAELHRVLGAGARVLILDTDWDSLIWHSRDNERMQRVLDGWRRRVADPHLPRTLATRLRAAGFEVTRCEVLPIFDPTGHEASYSAHQIDHLGASATGVPAAVVEDWAAELRDLARAGEYFFSINRYIFLAVAWGTQEHDRLADDVRGSRAARD